MRAGSPIWDPKRAFFRTFLLDGAGGRCYYRGMKKQDDEWLGFFLMGLLVLTIFLV